jgi:hypothetical protein
MAKIYASGNYVIVEDGDNLYEYAKGHTLYVLVDDIFYIKEITQGQYKVSVSDLEAGNITSEDSGDAYDVARFTTFLRENTGFKTAPGGSGAEWGSIRGTLSTQSDLQSALDSKQNTLTLTTTGTSGAATLVGSTLNVPQYSGGGGLSGIHNVNGYFDLTSQGISAQLTGSSTSSVSMGANQMYAYPFIPNKTITSVSLKINVVTLGAGVNCRILIYSSVAGVPTTKVYESANLDCSTFGVKTAITSFTFTAGTTYWLCLQSSGVTSLSGIQPTALIPLAMVASPASAPTVAYINTSTFGSAPTTFAINNRTNSAVPLVGIYLS